MPELKADLHIHTDEDEVDYHLIRYSTEEMIASTRAQGFQVIAVTSHRRPTVTPEQIAKARDQGLVLLAGVEAELNHRHVLVIGPGGQFKPPASFADLRAMRQDGYLVIAPHPFYPSPFALRGLLEQHPDAFDAVEFCHFYSRYLNPNRRAAAFAAQNHKPMVGTSDMHAAWQLGKTYSMIESQPTPEAIIAAVKAGRVRVVTQPLRFAPYLQGLVYKVAAELFWNIPYYFLVTRRKLSRTREG
jgi:predicted metal-dependent phosphoesterase TrpH